MVNEMSLAFAAVSVLMLCQLPAAEEKFATDVAKADAESAKIKHAAAETRLKAYREALTAATKAGDFDKAMQIKARIEELEQEPEAAPTHKKRLPGGIRILSASYGVNQSWADVTDKVELALLTKSPVVSDALFGDPAPEYQPGNTLVIRYESKGKLKLVAIFSGKPLILH